MIKEDSANVALFEYACLRNDKGEQVSKKLEEFIKKRPKKSITANFSKKHFMAFLTQTIFSVCRWGQARRI